jgi:hypothetical protein
MGEVYRAKDAKLDREVAIKVLPQALARVPERMARFDGRPKFLPRLITPTIGHIRNRGLGGLVRVVPALIEGPMLADRIEAGPLPLEGGCDREWGRIAP